MMRDWELLPRFCDQPFVWASLQATRLDWLLRWVGFPCGFASPSARRQETPQAPARRRSRWLLRPFQLSCVRDVLQATRLAWGTELQRPKYWQDQLRRRGLGFFLS